MWYTCDTWMICVDTSARHIDTHIKKWETHPNCSQNSRRNCSVFSSSSEESFWRQWPALRRARLRALLVLFSFAFMYFKLHNAFCSSTGFAAMMLWVTARMWGDYRELYRELYRHYLELYQYVFWSRIASVSVMYQSVSVTYHVMCDTHRYTTDTWLAHDWYMIDTWLIHDWYRVQKFPPICTEIPPKAVQKFPQLYRNSPFCTEIPPTCTEIPPQPDTGLIQSCYRADTELIQNWYKICCTEIPPFVQKFPPTWYGRDTGDTRFADTQSHLEFFFWLYHDRIGGKSEGLCIRILQQLCISHVSVLFEHVVIRPDDTYVSGLYQLVSRHVSVCITKLVYQLCISFVSALYQLVSKTCITCDTCITCINLIQSWYRADTWLIQTDTRFVVQKLPLLYRNYHLSLGRWACYVSVSCSAVSRRSGDDLLTVGLQLYMDGMCLPGVCLANCLHSCANSLSCQTVKQT